DPPGALRQGRAEPRGGADLRGRRHQHDADPRGEEVRQAEGAVDRAPDRGRAPGRVRGEQRLRDLPRREPVGVPERYGEYCSSISVTTPFSTVTHHWLCPR